MKSIPAGYAFDYRLTLTVELNDGKQLENAGKRQDVT